jgi:hypothetical protein
MTEPRDLKNYRGCSAQLTSVQAEPAKGRCTFVYRPLVDMNTIVPDEV